MDKFMRKNKGAISIFLVLVLLPMMSVASIFVDMSRINLAKSMAASAGDLALNTALTNYDSELKNLYGLFATSQNMEELMIELEDYYRDSLVAAGLGSAEADDYVGQIMDYLKTTTGTDDLMNIELTGFEVEAPTGGNLGNPAIIKSQIIEFMKYRAPLSLGTGFLDALNVMKDLSKQTELVEDKNKFYEKHQDLLSTLESAWWQIQLYQYADASKGFPTGDYITTESKTLAENVKQWSGKGQAIVKETVNYLNRWSYFRSQLTGKGTLQYDISMSYLCSECGIAYSSSSSKCTACDKKLTKSHQYQKWQMKWQGESITINGTYSEDSPANEHDVLSWLNDVLRALNTADEFETGEYKKVYDLVMNTPNSASSVEKIYAVCVMNEELAKPNNNYLKTIKTLLQNLVNLSSALSTCDPDLLNSTYVTSITVDGVPQFELASGGTLLYSVASTNLTSHLSLSEGEHLSNFIQFISRANGLYYDAYEDYDNASKDVPKNIDAIRDQAYEYDEKLKEKIGNLSAAIELLNKVMNQLSDPNSEYSLALKEWKNSANKLSDNTMGKNDLKEMEDLASIITVDRLKDLITRLTNAKTTLEGICIEIAKYKFAGTSWKDITNDINLTNVWKLLEDYKQDILDVVPKSEKAYDTNIKTIEGTVEEGKIFDSYDKAPWTSENSPDLTKEQRTLYTWMYNNFYKAVSNYSTATTPSQTTSADDDMSNMEANLEKQATAQNPEGEQSSTTSVTREGLATLLDPENKALPSTRWDEVKNAVIEGSIQTDSDALLKSTNEGNVLTKILEIATNFGTELRDNLYVTEYIMKMFSYNTIEAETYYEGKEGTAEGYGAFYSAPAEGSTEYTVVEAFAEYAEKIQTLTNNSINPNMNYMYGQEVEYIIYGKDGVTKTYGTIFVIRFALNTVYAFMDAEINNMTLAAATALFGTPPLTPLIPFAKAAMTIGLAIAESAYDLVQLRKGLEVPLMKNRDTWVMKASGIASEVKKELQQEVQSIANKAVGEIVDKGYAVLNNALQMTSEELQSYVSSSTDALNELFDASLDTVTDTILNRANEALEKVVSLCNDVNQQAMLKEDYVDMGATDAKVESVVASIKQWLSQQGPDDAAVYEVKKLAVEYLTANDGATIRQIFDTIKSQVDQNSLENGVNTILSEKLKEIKTDIERKISDSIDTVGSKLNGYINKVEKDLSAKLKEAAKEGGDKLKQVLSEQIGSAFGSIPEASGTSTSTNTTNALASLLSWKYSDYLRLFVVVGLFSNEEVTLLRIADVIELNMQKKNNEYAVITTVETVTKSRFFGLIKTTEEKEVVKVNNAAYSLTNAYTYLRIKATLQVKPLLMALPFMEDVVKNNLTGTGWYEIEYVGTMGY